MSRFAHRLVSCALLPGAVLTATSVCACAGAGAISPTAATPIAQEKVASETPVGDQAVPASQPASEAADGPAPGIIILVREGDTPPGSDGLPVSGLGLPATDSNGVVAFTGRLDDNGSAESFIWRDRSIFWRASEVDGPAPAGPSPLMGIGDNAEFIFQTMVSGIDALWSHEGLLLQAGQPAPGLGEGALVQLSRWPTMTPDATAFWVSDFTDGRGVRGKGRVLYRSPGATPDSIEVVLRSDDLVDGFPIARPRGLDLNYQVSSDGAHLIQVMTLDTGSEDDNDILYLDGHIELREGDLATQGGGTGLDEVWERFSRVAVNSQGDYLAVAVTDADSASDRVMVANGEIRLREGTVLDGITLSAQANVLAVTLDDTGRGAFVWSLGGFGSEYLFFACDVSRLEESVLVFQTGGATDLQDPDANIGIKGFADVGHGPALWLSAGDRLYAEVKMTDKSLPDDETLFEAVVGFPLPDCPAEGVLEAPVERGDASVS